MSNGLLTGRVLWLEPDKERSAAPFSPRKCIIIRAIARFPEKDAVVTELVPAAFIWRPFPQRLTHVLLKYSQTDDDSIQRTFRIGLSVADVFKGKRNVILTEGTPRERDISRLGIAIVRPWPIPSATDVRERISDDKLSRPRSS